MIKIQQISYQNGALSISDNPADIYKLITGEAFNKYEAITQLKIETSISNFRFRINDSIEDIVIGPAHTFELIASEEMPITKLAFDAVSLKRLQKNKNSSLTISFKYKV